MRVAGAIVLLACAAWAQFKSNVRLVVAPATVTDSKGRFVDGLTRGLARGEMDQSHGGAGLGMMICHNASSAMIFDVARGRHTEVTAMFELDLNLREFRTQARSLHFWSN